MKRTLSALEARRRLGEILEGVYYRGIGIVTPAPFAAVLSTLRPGG